MSSRIVTAFANLKGGTGKTTCTVGVAHEAASQGKRVLVIDVDGQCNASQYLTGRTKQDWFDLTIADVLDTDTPPGSRPGLTEVIVPSRRYGIDVAPAAAIGDMTAINTTLEKAKAREFVLRKALRKLDDSYELVLIDCPPAINVVTLNAHVAATAGIVLVASPTEGAYSGVIEMIREIDEANDPDEGLGEVLTHDIEFAGIVINDYDQRINRHTEYLGRIERLAESAELNVIGRPIPRLAFIPDAAVAGLGMDELGNARASYVRDQYAAIIDIITQEDR